MKKLLTFLVAPGLVLVSGCATMKPTHTLAEKRASCEAMKSEMGVNFIHDHGEAKGAPRNRMGLTHDECRKILAQPPVMPVP